MHPLTHPDAAAGENLEPPPRKLARQHFAFMRGLVQGVEVPALWRRYCDLEGPYETRAARAFVRWVRGEFMRACDRVRGPRAGALLLRQASRMKEDARPDLESFAAQFPPEFYTERELQELFEEAHGRAAGEGARERLMRRQLALLADLERDLDTRPDAGDRVEAWLPANLARRLVCAEIDTLARLVARINTVGASWWRRVARLGPVGAGRIQRWLADHAEALGVQVAQQALLPRALRGARRQLTPHESAIVPLERLLVPAALDGGEGTNRGERGRNRLVADNDYAAIGEWLALRAPNPHTHRAYRREAERLLLWALFEARMPLSSLGGRECAAYRDFLADPQPASRWTAPRNIERWSPAWRPLEGPLSARSLTTALTIVRSLFEFLTRQHYLASNPWDLVPKRTTAAQGPPLMPSGEEDGTDKAGRDELRTDPTDRALTQAQWRFVLDYLEQFPEAAEATHRLRFIVVFLYGTGLRLSELVSARLSHLYSVPLRTELGERWMLSVRGKGDTTRRVPIARAVIAHLEAYLEARGMDTDLKRMPLDQRQRAHLVAALTNGVGAKRGRAGRALSASMVYKLLKAFFMEAASVLRDRGLISDAEPLEAASTHWLRHTCGTHAVDAGVPLHVVQKNFGHASLNTTTIYVSAEEEKRYLEMERFVSGAIGVS